MNQMITLDDGTELIILKEINHQEKTYLLTDLVKDDQVQNQFNILEKIPEEEGFSIEEIQDTNLKAELAKLFK